MLLNMKMNEIQLQHNATMNLTNMILREGNRHTRFNIYKVQKEANKKVEGGKEAKKQFTGY